MTLDKINKARALAEKHGGKSGKIITALCDEIEHLTLKNQQLRRLMLRKGLHPVGLIEPWPYGVHRGKPLCDLDDDYLREWYDRQNPKGLRFDLDYAAVAERDLALYEHLRRHFKTKASNYPIPRRSRFEPRWKDLPERALDLAADVNRLDLVIHLLKHVDPLSTGNTRTQSQRDACGRKMRTTVAVIKGWKVAATEKLRVQYLAP